MKTYSRKVVEDESLKYFDMDSLASTTWANKYAVKTLDGEFCEKTPKDMHDRMIKEILRIESTYPKQVLTEDILKDMFYGFKYVIPGGSVMSGLGHPFKMTSLSNCFVIGNGADSYGGIFLEDQEQVQLCKRRGGVGGDISHLRPAGTVVTNDAQSSSGAVSFMHRISNSIREVGQAGRF